MTQEMNFQLSSEQQAIADSVARFVEREYDWDTRMRTIRGDDGRNPAHWATFAELGWLGAGLPEESGGFGGGGIENAVIAQQLGKALVNEPFATHVVAINLLADSGNDVVRAWIEPVVMGEMRIAVALHEPQARGDVRSIAASYERIEDGWCLNGTKSLVEAAGGTQRILVPAQGREGLAIFAVEPEADRLRKRPYRLLDSRHVCDLALDAVAVAPDALVIAGEAAEVAWDKALDHGLVTQCAEALGTMDAALHATRDYLVTRTQFKMPLASFQVLQHRMADMLIELEMTRSLLFHALGALDAEPRARAAASSALKVQTCSAGLRIAQEAIQMHGGIGVTEELAVSHYYRRLYVVSRLMGDESVHLDRFAQAATTG